LSQRRNSPGPGIVFTAVTKRYGGLFALRSVSLSIGSGEFVGLLGANGAGKSTLLRVAALLARPTEGGVEFPGAGADQLELKRGVAMVGHCSFLYEDLTARENLEFAGRIFGIENLAEDVDAGLDGAGLAGRSRGLVRTFSRGMRQRLAIARALLSRPGVLLLDEPETGLDADGRRWLASTLRRLRDSGCTILVSTHSGGEVLELASKAVWLLKGRIARQSDEPARALAEPSGA
jgi:heme exporter protein A